MHVNIARASCVTARRLNVLPLQDPPGLLARRDDRSFSAGAPWDERQHLTPGDSPDRVAASDSYQQHVGMAPAQVRRAPAATTVASHKVSAGSVAKPSNKLPLWAQRPAADEKQDEDSPRDDAGAVPRLFEFSKFCMLTGSLNGFHCRQQIQTAYFISTAKTICADKCWCLLSCWVRCLELCCIQLENHWFQTDEVGVRCSCVKQFLQQVRKKHGRQSGGGQRRQKGVKRTAPVNPTWCFQSIQRWLWT